MNAHVFIKLQWINPKHYLKNYKRSAAELGFMHTSVVLYCTYPCIFLKWMSHFEKQNNKQKLYGATTDYI